MNGRNRHKKYRKSVYQRRSIGTVIISVISTLAVVIIALMIIGNILKAQSDNRHANDSASPTDTSSPISAANIAEIHGCYIPSISINASELDAMAASGNTQICLPLTDGIGNLLYNSSVANGIGRPYAANASLSDTVTASAERGIYTSGVYYTNAFATESHLLRAVELSKDASLIAEALDMGINEVIIIAPHMCTEHVDEFIQLTENIRALTDKGFIGIAVNDCIFTDENVSVLMDKLNESVDLLAINASDPKEKEFNEYINETINSTNKFYLHMYKMRVLLPYSTDTAVQGEIIATAEKSSITNFQTYKKP